MNRGARSYRAPTSHLAPTRPCRALPCSRAADSAASASGLAKCPAFSPPPTRQSTGAARPCPPGQAVGLSHSRYDFFHIMADVSLTFPDGSRRDFPAGSTGRDVARSISEGLARNALAIRIGGQVRDLDRVIDADAGASVAILTWNDDDGKATFWHSTAHLMAEALESLYPGVRFGIGPAIEQGFYYDVDLGETAEGARKLVPEDLAAIETKMLELARRDVPFVRREVPKDRGARLLPRKGRPVQARTPRRPRRRHHLVLHAGRLHRPLPRPAPPVDGHDQSGQADQHRGRVLARRLRAVRSSPASTASPSPRSPNSTRGCACARRPSAATTASSGASSSSSCITR